MANELTLEQKKSHKRALMVTAFFAFVSIGSYAVSELYIYLIAYLWFGFIYGMVLQYGRFCFASAFRDLFAVGVPRMVVGIVIATILFSITVSLVTITGESTFHPAPYGIHMTIAGFIFGVGMVFAGGCASGSLYKTGEGNMTAALVVLSISVTQAIFADVAGWTNKLVPASWHASASAKPFPAVINAGDGWLDQYLAGYVFDQPATTIAKIFGLSNTSVMGSFGANFFIGNIVPGILVLIIVYAFWSRRSYLRGLNKSTTSFSDDIAGYWQMIVSSKRTAIAGLFLGVFCGLHMFVIQGLRMKFGVGNAGQILKAIGQDFGLSARGTVFDPGYWYVTTQEAQWVGWIFNKLGWDNMDNIYFGLTNGIPNPLFNPADWMSLALVGGAAVMALLANEFKFKKPTMELAVWAIVGGVLMGIGSRLALGCNVGGFFVRVANGDPSGLLFGVGMVGGAFIGVKFFNWWTERKMAKEMAAFDL